MEGCEVDRGEEISDGIKESCEVVREGRIQTYQMPHSNFDLL
jgi:hypothetical protein